MNMRRILLSSLTAFTLFSCSPSSENKSETSQNDFPEEVKKLLSEMSVEEKKVERFEQVINECYEFVDRFPDSKLRKETEDFLTRSKENIKNLTNE